MAADLSSKRTTPRVHGPRVRRGPPAAPFVVQLDTQRFAVASASSPGGWQYILIRDEGAYCTCLGARHRGYCRHEAAVAEVRAGRLVSYAVPTWPTR